MTISIRPYVAADCESIVDMIAEYRAEERRPAVNRSAIAECLHALAASERGDVFVADAANKVTGYISVHWIPFPLMEGLEAYISDLIVALSARGSGAGSRLLEAVESAARARGCVRLMLNNAMTDESFTRRFYPKHGFRQREGFANFVKLLR